MPPPCVFTECRVLSHLSVWFLLQLAAFSQLQFPSGDQMIKTYRPVQPLHGRPVYYSRAHVAAVSTVLLIVSVLVSGVHTTGWKLCLILPLWINTAAYVHGGLPNTWNIMYCIFKSKLCMRESIVYTDFMSKSACVITISSLCFILYKLYIYVVNLAS